MPQEWDYTNALGFYEYDLIPDGDKEIARRDIIDVVSKLPDEVPELLKYMGEGRIDGDFYGSSGANIRRKSESCTCLVGTLVKLHEHENMSDRQAELKIESLIRPPNVSSPAERWFLRIKTGDTPESSPYMRDAYRWIDEWHRDFLSRKEH